MILFNLYCQWQHRWAVVLVFFIFLVGPWTPTVPAAMEAHRYIEDDGKQRVEIQWCLSGTDEWRLTYLAPGATHITQTDAALHTVAWYLQDTQQDTDIEALRHGNTIEIKGRWRGDTLERRLTLDDEPWFQATSLSLRSFITSEAGRARFWIVRPDTLKAYKVNVVRQEDEQLSLASGQVRAVRVELRLAGMLAPFWSSRYWFRASDGHFLRFEGPGDATGRTTMTVVYEGTGGACTPDPAVDP